MWSAEFCKISFPQKVAKSKRKHPKSEDSRCFSGAAGRIWTADLILTKKVGGVHPPTSPCSCPDTKGFSSLLLTADSSFFSKTDRFLFQLHYNPSGVQETRCLNLIKHLRASFFVFLEHLNITAHLEANPVAKRSWNKDFNWWTYPIILDRFVVIIQSESERWNKTSRKKK